MAIDLRNRDAGTVLVSWPLHTNEVREVEVLGNVVLMAFVGHQTDPSGRAFLGHL